MKALLSIDFNRGTRHPRDRKLHLLKNFRLPHRQVTWESSTCALNDECTCNVNLVKVESDIDYFTCLVSVFLSVFLYISQLIPNDCHENMT